MTQNEAILAHLQSGASLTSLEALQRFQCFRLASRIHDLRKAGYDVSERSIRVPSGKIVSEYRLSTPCTSSEYLAAKGG